MSPSAAGLLLLVASTLGTPPASAPSSAPLSNAVIPESQFRPLLNAMHAAGESQVLNTIRAVNALQPLGKDKVLAVFEQYATELGNSVEQKRAAFVLLRILFESPADVPYPPLPLRRGVFDDPALSRLHPRFPVLLEGDIPVYLTKMEMGGMFGSVMLSNTIQWYREYGSLRSTPLRPTDDPLSVFDKLLTKPELSPYLDDLGQVRLANEILQLVATAYRFPQNQYGTTIIPGFGVAEQWRSVKKVVAKHGIRWDVKRECYVRGDGTMLPPEPVHDWKRHTWQPAIDGATDVSIVFERRNDEWADVRVNWVAQSATAAPAVVEVFSPSDPKSLLMRMRLAPSSQPADDDIPQNDWSICQNTMNNGLPAVSRRAGIHLPEGHEVRAQVRQADKSQRSPVYKP